MKSSKQIDLFGDLEPNAVSIDDAAQRLGVSTATIRNWLKTGYLKPAGRAQITEDSLNQFQTEIAGKEKLNQRANKSLKDSHDHNYIAAAFIDRAQSKDMTASSLGEEYETSLSDSYRNKEGIYYTPDEIVCDLLSSPQTDLSLATFCDPCCGSGNFIIRALELGFHPENIYGYDVDPVAVEITKARVYQQSGYQSSNIQKLDFLSIASDPAPRKFDFIYTNPPWGKKLPNKEKRALGNRFKTGSSLDTCSLFFFACLSCLNGNGTLGLLLPESFFNISTFESARHKALRLSIERLVDYGKAFRGLVTKAQAIVIKNKPGVPNHKVKCESDQKRSERSMTSFSENPKAIFNLHCGSADADTLEFLRATPHITLANQASWGLGIVTGNNKKHIKTSPEQGYMPVFKGSDISATKLKEPSNYIPCNLDLYQQVAPCELFEAKEKLIYKFISSRLCFFYDQEQRFVLNSANILIPNDDFPVSTNVLGQLLSSDFMNWIFKSIFNTHKILRGDIELLPIHSQFLRGEYSFDEEKYLTQLQIEKTNDGTYRIKR